MPRLFPLSVDGEGIQGRGQLGQPYAEIALRWCIWAGLLARPYNAYANLPLSVHGEGDGG